LIIGLFQAFKDRNSMAGVVVRNGGVSHPESPQIPSDIHIITIRNATLVARDETKLRLF
jgi:hypothetical protein